MSDSVTLLDDLLKQVYPAGKVANLVVTGHKFLELVKKTNEFNGNSIKQAIIWGSSQGVASTFATAQTNAIASNTANDSFLVSARGKLYGIHRFDRELMLASDSKDGAFVSEMEVAVENMTRQLGIDLASTLYRSGYGDLGQIGSQTTLSSTTLYLASPEDVVNYEVGMRLDVGATQSGAVRTVNGGVNPYVVGLDETGGTLTLNVAINDGAAGFASVATGDFIFRAGNHSSGAYVLPRGLEGWIPPVMPTSGDSWWTVDRSQSTRLAGLRLDATAMSLEEALIKGAQRVARAGGKTSHIMCSIETFIAIVTAMQGRYVIIDPKQSAATGFDTAEIILPGAGAAKIIADRTCPPNRIFFLQMDTWRFAHLKDFIQRSDEDGLMLKFVSTADQYELRFAVMGQLICSAPGYNLVARITPQAS